MVCKLLIDIWPVIAMLRIRSVCRPHWCRWQNFACSKQQLQRQQQQFLQQQQRQLVSNDYASEMRPELQLARPQNKLPDNSSKLRPSALGQASNACVSLCVCVSALLFVCVFVSHLGVCFMHKANSKTKNPKRTQQENIP